MSNTITITKGKLLKETVSVEFIERDNEGNKTEGSNTGTAPAHPDLRSTFDSLTKHLAFFLSREFVKIDTNVDEFDEVDIPQIDKFKITGFAIAKGEDMAGVILSGQFTCMNGKPIGFNTPVIPFNEELFDGYPFLETLVNDINNCRNELKLYLGGKHGAKEDSSAGDSDSQNENEIGISDDTSANDATETGDVDNNAQVAAQKPKRGRKPKEVETEI